MVYNRSIWSVSRWNIEYFRDNFLDNFKAFIMWNFRKFLKKYFEKYFEKIQFFRYFYTNSNLYIKYPLKSIT